MKIPIFALMILSLSILAVNAQENITPGLYGTADWNADSLGNHRVVIKG